MHPLRAATALCDIGIALETEASNSFWLCKAVLPGCTLASIRTADPHSSFPFRPLQSGICCLHTSNVASSNTVKIL
ncbi:hypothetical protein STEG23_026943 [Scotinomys teguina]